MTVPQNNRGRFVAVCLVAALFTPAVYIAVGALGAFAPMFAVVFLPPLTAAVGWLVYRLGFAAPGGRRVSAILLSALAWGVIGFFLTIVSGYTLFKPWERIGVLCAFYWLALLPVGAAVWVKRERIAALPSWMQGDGPVWACALLIIATAAGAIQLLLRPAGHL